MVNPTKNMNAILNPTYTDFLDNLKAMTSS